MPHFWTHPISTYMSNCIEDCQHLLRSRFSFSKPASFRMGTCNWRQAISLFSRHKLCNQMYLTLESFLTKITSRRVDGFESLGASAIEVQVRQRLVHIGKEARHQEGVYLNGVCCFLAMLH